MSKKWIELTYHDMWTHRPKACILTGVETKYGNSMFPLAIYGKDIGRNVAFAPMFGEHEYARRELNREEAFEYAETVRCHCPEMWIAFHKAYPEDI